MRRTLQQQTTPERMIFFMTGILFLLIYICLLLYYRYSWTTIPVFKPEPTTQPHVFITVIIPARNEELNLPVLLHGLQDQTYPSRFFEIIVVDDHSTDRTHQVVTELAITNLKMVRLADFVNTGINSYKKKAIEIAISQSKGELIVTTDADCIVRPAWLQNIASFYEEHKPELIVMPVSVDCSNNILEIFQALDFMTLQGITGASVHKKFHNMCNGANLSYTKSAFDAAGGFKGIDNLASGDDMMLMHKISKLYPEKLMYLRSKDVIVNTAPEKTLALFINQRIRWTSKSGNFGDKRILAVLLFVYAFNSILFILPFIAVFSNDGVPVFNYHLSLITFWLFLVFSKTIIELFFLYPVAKFFNKQGLLFIFPLLQPFHIIYTVIVGVLGKFGTFKWKGRKVK